MAHRGIEKITMYDNGLIMCQDADGRQAPPLQGFFQDVIHNIVKFFGPDDVEWYFLDGEDFKKLPFSDWFEKGREIAREQDSIEMKPVDEMLLRSTPQSSDLK